MGLGALTYSMSHKYNYQWKLAETKFTKDQGKVFSCFSCGGGSTMGYKLAGFDVIGCNEIDKSLAELYVTNHNPKYCFVESIADFKNRSDLPKELFELDILDGSPPCSSFSMSGQREKMWGKKKKFREGQVSQVLDTLFFDFIDLAKKLQPKIVVAENVMGLLTEQAKHYVDRIYSDLTAAGYYVQHHVVNAADVGVPQNRRRVFFIGIRNDVAKPHLRLINLFDENVELDMKFDEEKIPVKDIIFSNPFNDTVRQLSPATLDLWTKSEHTFNFSKVHPKGHRFNHYRLNPNAPAPTITATATYYNPYEPKALTSFECMQLQSFPSDYNAPPTKLKYMCGMSVPPLVIANIADRLKFLLQ